MVNLLVYTDLRLKILLIYVVDRHTDRVIQMIDENKEQLRNLFRNYNVLDVQPAVSGRAPDDLTTLQVSVHDVRAKKSSG